MAGRRSPAAASASKKKPATIQPLTHRRDDLVAGAGEWLSQALRRCVTSMRLRQPRPRLTAAPLRDYSPDMIQLGDAPALTAEDLFLIASSDSRDELDRGVLVRMPPAGALHGQLASHIGYLLEEHVEAEKLGVVCSADTGFVLARDPDTVRAPDASFVARERIPTEGPPVTYWPFAPDLAVEVVSPTDRVGELDEKIAQYFAAGTRLVWVVHPRTRTVHVYRPLGEVQVLGVSDELAGEPVLPDFRCPLRRLFA